MRVEQFRVVLSGFRVRELPTKRSKVFVLGNFDNFKQFKTDSTDNELYGGTWDKFEVQFHYETKYSDKLDKKNFELHVFKEKFFSNGRIGSISVDLYTLACGPTHHDIMLLNKDNVSVGRIEFDCIFEHVANMVISLKDITLCLPQNFHYERGFEVYLQVSFYPDSKGDIIYNTDICKMASKYFHWESLRIVQHNTSTKKMLATKMLIEVKSKKKKKTIGVCWVKFKRIYNPLEPSKPIPINLKLTKYIHRYHPEHTSCERSPGGQHGVLKGYFVFENPPVYGQMIDGVHTENGVFRGHALLAGMPCPVFIRHPDSPDGRYSSIGNGYYEKHFTQNGSEISEKGFDDVAREKLQFEKEVELQISRANFSEDSAKFAHSANYAEDSSNLAGNSANFGEDAEIFENFVTTSRVPTKQILDDQTTPKKRGKRTKFDQENVRAAANCR
eukprot:Phypoly_transcript_08542.p1 GENE.Phypoly_transcript_08542~~Phypoly_transcript_08542.p1  ORF type:complete len:444 (+),score=72.23 Phypoly_transcript_08542:95-1426(+)